MKSIQSVFVVSFTVQGRIWFASVQPVEQEEM
jgi:hypothetical protein